MQGVVMEIKENRCVVLKKDGTFAEIPNRNYTVGQTVTLSRSAVRRSLSLAACLAVVCLAGAGYHLYFTPASYIYLDINPSVRLDLNCFERVIDVVPLNEDAETLLADSTIGKGKVSDCMSAIVSACREQNYLNEDSKVFVKGRVSEEDDAPSKLICETIIPFEETKRELWIQYGDKLEYGEDEPHLFDMLGESEGNDTVVIYCKRERAIKRLPAGRNVCAEPALIVKLKNYYGEDRIRVVEKSIER